MTIRARHYKYIDRASLAESDTIKIHKPNEAGERHLCPATSEKARIRPSFGLSHPVPCGDRLQHIVAETPDQEIMAGYQLVNSLIELPAGVGYLGGKVAANLAAFTSASGFLVVAVRGANNPNSRSGSCHASCGIEILCR
jgi:hypothetical protein